MRVSKQGGGNVNIVLNEERIRQVAQFCYLGSLIADNGSCGKEIRARIAMAKTAFNRRKELLTRSMKRKVKKKIIKTVVWSVLLYGLETWSLKMEDIKPSVHSRFLSLRHAIFIFSLKILLCAVA